MKSQKKFLRGSQEIRRQSPGQKTSGKSFLIVTEGEQTEPNYFRALGKVLQLTAAKVEVVHPEGTDPKTLVTKAIELRDAQKQKSRKGLGVEYDEVWVVYDLEKPQDQRRQIAKEARQIRGSGDIHFAESDPCFEIWLLFHFHYSTAQHENCASVVKVLKEHLAHYSKSFVFDEDFIRKLPTAITNSEKIRKHHNDTRGDGNPGTSIDILASSMNQATRKHFRIPLE